MNLLKALDGYKTYISQGAALFLVVLYHFGVDVPYITENNYPLILQIALGLTTIKHGQERLSRPAKQVERARRG